MTRPKPLYGRTLLDDLGPTPNSCCLLRPRRWGAPLSCPFLQLGSPNSGGERPPPFALSMPGRLTPSCQPGGQGPRQWWWHCPLLASGHHPWFPSGWGPVRGELPVQPRLPIGHKVPQCPPPTSPSPAGATTSVVVANAAQSSGHSCASQRPASPTRSQTPQLCAPNPSPPARLLSRIAQSPQPLPLRLPGPVLPGPSPTRPVPLGQAHLGA